MGKPTPVGGILFGARANMMIMHACGRVVMSGGDWMDSNTLLPLCLVCLGACSYVLSCPALNCAALHGPDCSGAYPILESPWAPLLGVHAGLQGGSTVD
jgi:hypothetical protein